MKPNIKFVDNVAIFKLDTADVTAWGIEIETLIKPKNNTTFAIALEGWTVQDGKITGVRRIPIRITGVTTLHNDGTLEKVMTSRRIDDQLDTLMLKQLSAVTTGLHNPYC